jgi:hypothetical protein
LVGWNWAQKTLDGTFKEPSDGIKSYQIGEHFRVHLRKINVVDNYHFIVIGRKGAAVSVRGHPVLRVGMNGDRSLDSSAISGQHVAHSAGFRSGESGRTMVRVRARIVGCTRTTESGVKVAVWIRSKANGTGCTLTVLAPKSILSITNLKKNQLNLKKLNSIKF